MAVLCALLAAQLAATPHVPPACAASIGATVGYLAAVANVACTSRAWTICMRSHRPPPSGSRRRTTVLY